MIFRDPVMVKLAEIGFCYFWSKENTDILVEPPRAR